MALHDNISSNWKKLQKTVKKPSKKTIVRSSKVVKKTIITTKPKKDNTVNLIRRLNREAKERESESIEDSALSRDLPSDEQLDKSLSNNKKLAGKYLAIDCEFVGIGPDGIKSALARVSIVNFHGHCVYDNFVQPTEFVTDWRTWVSGVTPAHMKNAISFQQAQKEVSDLLKDKILIGHAVDHDLEALWLSHPKTMVRDTSRHLPFRELSKGKTPSLKKLAKEVLGVDIQGGEHSSVEDARATMMLYKLHKKDFEKKHQRFKTKE